MTLKLFIEILCEKNVREYTDDEKFDIIMMNPPFGGSELETIKNNFPAELGVLKQLIYLWLSLCIV
ncbi:type I restriction-modification system M protein [Streptococcus pneumoniae]|nr:type I restriction-modification system M protein [Streptococcus pneumoniae]